VAQSRDSKREPKSSEVSSRAAPGTLESGKPQLKNWAAEKDSPAYLEAARLYPLLVRCYENKEEQASRITEFWSIYNAQPDENQRYLGNSQGYIPAVRDCVNARAKRAVTQLFPTPHRHVEAFGTDAETPYPQMALLEHYIRKLGLKDIVRSDLVAGDVTGQWNLYVDWFKRYRRVTQMVRRNPILESVPGQEVDLIDPTTEREEPEVTDLLEEGPDVVDVATEDVAILPPTCNDIEKSEASCVRLYLSRDAVKRYLDEGVFDFDALGAKDKLHQWAVLDKVVKDDSGSGVSGVFGRSPPKQRTQDAGIQTEGTVQILLAFEAAAMLDFGGGSKQLGLIYYGGSEKIIGIIKAPWWGGKRPLLSASTERVKGSFFGVSKIEPVKFLQWNLTDFWNMGQDSAQYALLPIVMTDPLSNPNWASMVVGLAAVWGVDPNKTKFAEFPPLWKDAAQICDLMKRQIWESMDVNEMMMGRTPQGRKNNQMIGAMQQEAMISIMDHAARYEEVMLNPLMERLFEYDCQFRTEELTVMTRGELGVKAKMQKVPPQQWGSRYQFGWTGTSFVMGMQRMQSQIATMNVLRGIPPQQLNGRKLDITPILETLVENVFGSEKAPRILIDERNLFTIPAEVEDEMMLNNLDVMVHEGDDDVAHVARHQGAARLTQDPTGRFRAHIAAHMGQLQRKREMAMAQQMQAGQGVPGAPGPSVGGPAQPGMAGTPRPGAQPAGPRQIQGPPGMVGPDSMVDAGAGGRG